MEGDRLICQSHGVAAIQHLCRGAGSRPGEVAKYPVARYATDGKDGIGQYLLEQLFIPAPDGRSTLDRAFGCDEDCVGVIQSG